MYESAASRRLPLARFALFLVVALLVAACAYTPARFTGPRLSYTPPDASPKGAVSRYVAQPPAVVFGEIRRILVASELRLTRVEPDRGLIVAQYGGDPRQYVDCGTVDVWLGREFEDSTRQYSANRPEVSVPRQINGLRQSIIRKLRLDARLVVTVAKEGSGTRIISQADYVLTKRMELPPDYQNADFGPRVEVVSFTSDSSGTFLSTVRCVGRGRLEKLVTDPFKQAQS